MFVFFYCHLSERIEVMPSYLLPLLEGKQIIQVLGSVVKKILLYMQENNYIEKQYLLSALKYKTKLKRNITSSWHMYTINKILHFLFIKIIG